MHTETGDRGTLGKEEGKHLDPSTQHEPGEGGSLDPRGSFKVGKHTHNDKQS